MQEATWYVIMNNRMLRRMDFTLIMSVLAIVVISLIVIGSATHINNPGEERYWFV